MAGIGTSSSRTDREMSQGQSQGQFQRESKISLIGKFLIVALMGILVCSCSPGEPQATLRDTPTVLPAEPQMVEQSVEPRYLALGDSYTIGEGVRVRDRWPIQLTQRLREDGFTLADPLIIARTGWTTDELLTGIERVNPQGSYALVSLLIGVNNQYRGRDLDTYRQDLQTLLREAVALANGESQRILVLSIPDWGVTPFAAGLDQRQIGDQIDRFNAVTRQETQNRGAQYVDITPQSRRARADATLVAADGLHPSAQMYREWVDLALPTAKQILQAAQ